jgi:molybdopterin converting factor subunit 1
LKILVKFFASHREYAGVSELEIEVPDQSTISELLDILFQRFPDLQKLKDETIVSQNKIFAEPENKLTAGDEVALFPPVSGG